eukprot:Sspe_Gene.23897::Locus_9358_Transcript_1_1_Confidence_1.000_Length_591::g.23897::m.23897
MEGWERTTPGSCAVSRRWELREVLNWPNWDFNLVGGGTEQWEYQGWKWGDDLGGGGVGPPGIRGDERGNYGIDREGLENGDRVPLHRKGVLCLCGVFARFCVSVWVRMVLARDKRHWEEGRVGKGGVCCSFFFFFF